MNKKEKLENSLHQLLALLLLVCLPNKYLLCSSFELLAKKCFNPSKINTESLGNFKITIDPLFLKNDRVPALHCASTLKNGQSPVDRPSHHLSTSPPYHHLPTFNNLSFFIKQ